MTHLVVFVSADDVERAAEVCALAKDGPLRDAVVKPGYARVWAQLPRWAREHSRVTELAVLGIHNLAILNVGGDALASLPFPPEVSHVG